MKLSEKANSGYSKATAEAELGKGIAGLISFGTLFLANPDLPERTKSDAALNEPDRATCLAAGQKVTSITRF